MRAHVSVCVCVFVQKMTRILRKMATTTKFAKPVGNIFTIFMAMTILLLLCCCCCRPVNGQPQQSDTQQQQQQQQQQQMLATPQAPPHKYQQLQFQLQQQQQQQYEYQQQLHQLLQKQQQEQQHQQQQQQFKYHQQQKQAADKQEKAIYEQETEREREQQQQRVATPTQMIRTGASLVVGDENQPSEPSNYYGDTSGVQPASTRRRQSASNMRGRTRRPAVSGDESGQQQYWRGRVENDNTPGNPSQGRDELRGGGSRKRKQPAIREPLAALEKEQKLYELRDKQRQETAPSGSARDKSYRRPYSQAKKDAELTVGLSASGASGKTAVDLKHILKNAGGLSLSEILQQKNLSLDDLLKGKQNALQVLQSTAAAPQPQPPPTPTKTLDSKPIKPMRRVPYFSSVEEAADGVTQQTHTEGDFDLSVESRTTPDATAPDVDAQLRSKVKMPTLHRLKYFSSSTRVAAGSTTRRVSTPPSATTTTSTTTTTTTTRLPIYKKNFMLRSTLKPTFMLKNVISSAPSSAEPDTSDETNFEEKLTTTIVNNRYNREPTAVGDEGLDEQELAADEKPDVKTVTPDNADTEEQQEEEYLRDEEETDVQPTSKFDFAERDLHYDLPKTSISTTLSTTPTTLATTKLTIAPKLASSAPSSQATSTTSENAAGERTKPALGTQSNLKTNSIETDDTRVQSRDANVEINGLENFFGGETTATKQQRAKSTTAVVENITPRIDYVKPAIPGDTYSYQDSVPDFDGVDDRTDLLELIEDRRSGNRLFKVLEQRNMTLEELIEHRKRGSSQLHLATVVQNRSRFFPGQKVVLHDNMDIVTAFENFPHFNLMDLKSVKPDDIKTDSQGASYFTSIIDIEPTDEIYKDETGGGGGKGSAIQPQRTEKAVGFFPSWKTLALASLATSTRNDASTKRNPFFLQPPQMLLENTSVELDDNDFLLDNETNTKMYVEPPQQQELTAAQLEIASLNHIDTVEAIENEVARAHDLLDLELSGHGFKRSPATAAVSIANSQSNIYSNMPASIRSAIVASAAIVLTSLVTFMVIFVVCRWKQRRQRKTSYTKTYNAMKSKLPTVANSSRRSSLRNMEELVGGVSTVSVSPVHQLQRQSSLLFPRHCSSMDVDELSGGTGCGGGGRRSKIVREATRNSLGNSGGIGSATGSTTSLALSLQSVHNSSTNRLNTMDPNSPEVQEYLFDALRKSY